MSLLILSTSTREFWVYNNLQNQLNQPTIHTLQFDIHCRDIYKYHMQIHLCMLFNDVLLHFSSVLQRYPLLLLMLFSSPPPLLLPTHTHIHFNYSLYSIHFHNHFFLLLTSLAISSSCSLISAKSGLRLGSFSHNLSISSLIFGCVFFGIFGLNPCFPTHNTTPPFYPSAFPCNKTNKQTNEKKRQSTFWTTPTAACNGVMYSYGSCRYINVSYTVTFLYRTLFFLRQKTPKITLPVNNSHSTIP